MGGMSPLRTPPAASQCRRKGGCGGDANLTGSGSRGSILSGGWAMKKTALAMCSCAIAVASIGFTWVDASAQSTDRPPADKDAEKAPPTMCRCQGESHPTVAAIRKVLGEPLKSPGLEFTEEPLENVVNFLQEEYDIPIQIDVTALENGGVTLDQPVSINLRDISLGAALRLMLKNMALTYAIENEVLLITTPDEADIHLVACVYDVRDLIGRNMDLETLAGVIASCVAAETWVFNEGGEAQIKTLRPGLIVVSQTRAVHEEIADLLALVRLTLRQPNLSPDAEATGAMGAGEFGEGGMGMEGGYGEYGRGMGREPTPASPSK
jgi:hypothetical protein